MCFSRDGRWRWYLLMSDKGGSRSRKRERPSTITTVGYSILSRQQALALTPHLNLSVPIPLRSLVHIHKPYTAYPPTHKRFLGLRLARCFYLRCSYPRARVPTYKARCFAVCLTPHHSLPTPIRTSSITEFSRPAGHVPSYACAEDAGAWVKTGLGLRLGGSMSGGKSRSVDRL